MSDGFSKFKKGIQLDPQSADPSNPAEGDQFYSDGTSRAKGMWQYKDGTWAEFGGSGSSGINYLSGDNSDAENGVGDHTAYADAAATTPVDGTGGAPTVTVTQNTSTPLRGTADILITKDAANRQGEGDGCAFTIDSADQAKKLTIKFDYTTSANYADDDIKVFVYDVTNSNLIRVNGEDLKATSGNGTHYAQFQTASNSTSYRLILHVSSTNASAYTVNLDNISVGPTNLAFGTIVTEMKSFTPTFENLTLGTGGTATFKERRVGDRQFIEGSVLLGTGGSITGALFLVLPNDLDQSKSSRSTYARLNGFARGFDNSTGQMELAEVIQEAALNKVYFSSKGDGQWNATSPVTWGASDEVIISFDYPVAGWSSNAQMSEDLGGREIAVRATTSVTSIPSGADTPVIFSVEDYDTTASFNLGTSVFTAPESGKYAIGAHIEFASTAWTAGITARLGIDLNGGNILYLRDHIVPATYTSNLSLSGSTILDLVKGDTIEITAFQNVGTVLLEGGPARNYMSIQNLASPQTILETETVAARYNSNAAPTINTTFSTIAFEDIAPHDTHNAYNTSTGIYTTPTPGVYSIKSQFLANNQAWTLDQYVGIQIMVNGTEIKQNRTTFSGGNQVAMVDIADEYPLTKGDTVEIQGYSSISTTLTTASIFNIFSIARIK